MDLTGRTLLGKYEIEALIGRGGMGAVWRARHALTGRKLAIKTLEETYLGNQPIVQRFGREARAASAVHHPGIVEVLDLDQTEEGVPFLVMEFLEGESLASRIERRGRLGQDELLRLGVLLLEALDAAHTHGVIHRDLKPENVYVVPAGRRGEAIKILDFGISHKADEALAHKLTVTGSVLGTPHYMSPEQAMGEEIDHRADIYAAGVVLYECAVGDVPFDASNYNKLLRTILDSPPVPPRQRGAEISEGVERVILWALEKERDSRVASAREMLRWLREAAEGREVPYRPRSPLPEASSEVASASSGTDWGTLPGISSRPPPPKKAPIEPPAETNKSLRVAPLPPLQAAPVAQRPRSVPPPSGLAELDLDDPLGAGAPASLEIDEAAMRSAPPSRQSTSGLRPVRPPSLRPAPASLPPAARSGRHEAVAPAPAPIEPPAWRRYAIWGGAGLLVFVGLVVGLRLIVRPGETTVEPSDDPIERPHTEPSPLEERWVSIRIVGLPPDARIRVDGLPATSPVRLPRGGAHVVEVTAPGYEDRRIELTADDNREIDARMRPAEGTGIRF